MTTISPPATRVSGISQRAADRVRGMMAAQRLTSGDLGPVLGLSRSAVSTRVQGKVAMTLDELESISIWLGCPLEALIIERGAAAYSP